MRQKATAARPNAPAPAAAPSAPVSPATIQTLGQQLREVLPPRRLHSVSVCDHDANVLWLSEGQLGPDENALVVEALETLAADSTIPCHETALEDGRYALFLPVRAPTGALVGIAMILADCKSVGDDTLERVTAAPVRAVMQRLAVLMKPADPSPEELQSGSVTASLPVLELEPEPVVVLPPPAGARASPASAPPAAAPRAASAAEDMLPDEVLDILEIELAPAGTPAPPILRPPLPPTGRNETSSVELVSLEFLPEAPPAAPARPAPTAPTARAPTARAVAPAPKPAATPAPTPTSAPAMAAPASDANLILEVLPFAKLRAGGNSRRFQILPRSSAPQRDPAAYDALILQRLLGWLAAHRASWNSQPTTFTVNLSIATLEDERFAQKIGAALNSHGIAAETFGFEIAEALCTQRRAQLERFISQCEKLGSWVVIDDFSFDSQVLPLLRSKAVRLVKISPRLSSSALKDKLSQALVVASVQAAKVMGIHCAAQKVDSQAALQWLTAIGCDFAQGAALSPPQPLDALANSTVPTIITAALRPT